MQDMWRSLLTIRLSDMTARVDILRSGQVRLRVNDNAGADLVTETLEDLMLEAALHPKLTPEAYEQLHWELDLLALRGE